MKDKLPYPLVIIRARDWAVYDSTYVINPDDEDWSVTDGWMVGFLIKEQKDSVVIAFEVFPGRPLMPNKMRHVQVVPKETILYKKVIKEKK